MSSFETTFENRLVVERSHEVVCPKCGSAMFERSKGSRRFRYCADRRICGFKESVPLARGQLERMGGCKTHDVRN